MKKIPLSAMCSIFGRDENWMRSIWKDRYSALSFPQEFTLHQALILLNRLPKRTRVWHRPLNVKLPMTTWRVVRQHCEGASIQQEDFIRLIAIEQIDAMRKSPNPYWHPPKRYTVVGMNRILRSFCTYGCIGLRLIAFACDSSPSLVLDWAIWNYLEDKSA
jgi:hypothetical protein